jgi:hypothetical protein
MAIDTAAKQASILNAGTPCYVVLPWVDASAVEEQQHFLHLFSDPLATGAPADPPDPAINPNPVDTATSQPTASTILSWDNGGGADSYNVYFGVDPTPDPGEFQGNQVTTTFNPGTLAFATTYYWRIDPVNGAGTTTGDVWSFETVGAPVGGVPENPAAGYSDLLKAWWDL